MSTDYLRISWDKGQQLMANVKYVDPLFFLHKYDENFFFELKGNGMKCTDVTLKLKCVSFKFIWESGSFCEIHTLGLMSNKDLEKFYYTYYGITIMRGVLRIKIGNFTFTQLKYYIIIFFHLEKYFYLCNVCLLV